LRDQKKQKCFEIEKSKLADSQIEAKQFLIKEKSTNDIKDIDKKIKELRQQIEVLKQTKYEIAQSMRKKIVKEQKAFIMRCQAANCNGFVSKSYKCELCDKTTCSKCFIILTEDHECKADDIETASYIKQNSKPCPKCATRISRIDGCSQMWCTNCQTPFDWTSGIQLTNVVVHNPHYFQYLQQANAGIMPRNPNDVLCGGMPDLARFRSFSSIVLHDKDLQKCDLLEVYSELDVDKLKKTVNCNWNNFIENDALFNNVTTKDNISFEVDVSEEYTKLMEQEISSSRITLKLNENKEINENEEIDIDDI
jgi:hypothetical protein